MDDTYLPVYNNVARLYIVDRNDPDGALKMLLPALQVDRDPKSEAVLHKNTGWAYLANNQQVKALDHLHQAEQLFLTMDARYVDISAYLAETYGLIARAQTALGRAGEAQDAWQSSLSYALAVVELAACTPPRSRGRAIVRMPKIGLEAEAEISGLDSPP